VFFVEDLQVAAEIDVVLVNLIGQTKRR